MCSNRGGISNFHVSTSIRLLEIHYIQICDNDGLAACTPYKLEDIPSHQDNANDEVSPDDLVIDQVLLDCIYSQVFFVPFVYVLTDDFVKRCMCTW